MRAAFLLLTAATAAGAACSARDTARDTTFVTVAAALRRLQSDEALDSAARDSARRQVLQGRGLSPAEFEAMARELAGDPDRAKRVWDEIERRLAGPGAPGAPGAPRRARK